MGINVMAKDHPSGNEATSNTIMNSSLLHGEHLLMVELKATDV